MVNSIIVQPTSNDHDQIRKVIFRVSQYILHNSTAFDPRNGMFNSDTNLRYLAITLFLFGSQFLLARLFFG